jgi:hypothetical protein
MHIKTLDNRYSDSVDKKSKKFLRHKSDNTLKLKVAN